MFDLHMVLVRMLSQKTERMEVSGAKTVKLRKAKGGKPTEKVVVQTQRGVSN
jgi:hypothetical protein